MLLLDLTNNVGGYIGFVDFFICFTNEDSTDISTGKTGKDFSEGRMRESKGLSASIGTRNLLKLVSYRIIEFQTDEYYKN
ncbi:hypothetical protein Glove_772g11 [Diversispora epigaea]|uniref:Uncharacterized protein n=1 Tax=Diversispora epigaea TaxID=1348612 RepID=A0A397FZ46_9GLOM|nr:hypothetical protein Glove_772g11 [Diversispora epigaea]